MSLNMYLGEVQAQTQSMNAFCVATIQGMEQAISSIDAFMGDAVLQGQTYDSAKTYFAQTFRPLAQGIIYLCEELIRQNNAFPNDFQSKVATTDVIEEEIREQIREIDRMKAGIEEISNALPAMQVMMGIFDTMKQKLQEKLEHLYEFNYTSSSNYDTALQLATSIAQGLAEVQSGKGFSPASGTFSTQELNMDWIKPIQKITEDKLEKLEDAKLFEGEEIEKSMLEKAWDAIYYGSGQAVGDTIEGFKSLGDWETWENMGYAALHPIDTLSTMYNVLSDSFMRDVWNGDLESGTRWFSYGLTQIALGVLGDKGLSKVSKVTTSANLAKGMSKVTNSATYRNALNTLNDFKLNIGNRFAYADVGGSSIKYELDGAYQEAKDLLNQFAVSKEEYKYLRRRTPNDRVRKNVNTDVPKVDPVYGYEVEKLEADHIVSMKEITDMEGFDLLPREQQIEVLNTDENFVGLGKSTNASKNAKDWSTWSGHPKYGEVPENIRLEMLEREAVAREALKKSIKERLQSIENNS